MGKKRDKPMHLNMSFEEALGRFAKVNPQDAPLDEAKRTKQKVGSLTAPSSKRKDQNEDTPS